MAVHLTDRNVAHDIAARIRKLIARQDHGDVTAAARRLERPIADVYLPERVISSGDEPAVIDFLATVIRTYEADVCWLITGTTARSSGERTLSIEDRVTIVELLDELSDRLIDDVRNERQANGNYHWRSDQSQELMTNDQLPMTHSQ
ncbi:MAG: hypothetical protein JF602_05960 [Gemmatimonadetes bacterium]|nr:hypothetical protein [Gemmatimonadota bacterium]